VITGFNTDIEFQGVTYHVQTEDKGVETPLILSLVYDRGTILASKRTPYEDLLERDFDEKDLSERLQRQHKLICAAVRAGRIDDLKRMTQKEAASKRKTAEAKADAKQIIKPAAEIKKAQVSDDKSLLDDMPPPPQLLNIQAADGEVGNSPNSNAPNQKLFERFDDNVLEIPISILEDLIIDEVQVIEDEMIFPDYAVEIVPELPKSEPAEITPVEEPLKIELLNEVSLKAGERKTLSVLVRRGNAENGLSGAHVMVKVFGTSFRPLIFHAKTDSNGVAIVYLQLPHFSGGRAAVLVRAMSGGDEAELRRSISQD
jgi:hypothetical protein